VGEFIKTLGQSLDRNGDDSKIDLEEFTRMLQKHDA
jgi:hypothetical protein